MDEFERLIKDSAPRVQAPTSIHRRVMKRIETDKRQGSRRFRKRMPLVLAGLAMSLVLLAVPNVVARLGATSPDQAISQSLNSIDGIAQSVDEADTQLEE